MANDSTKQLFTSYIAFKWVKQFLETNSEQIKYSESNKMSQA